MHRQGHNETRNRQQQSRPQASRPQEYRDKHAALVLEDTMSDSDDTQITLSESESRPAYRVRNKTPLVANNDNDDDESVDEDDNASVEEEEAYQHKMSEQIRRGLQEAQNIQTPRISDTTKKDKHDRRNRALQDDVGNSRPAGQNVQSLETEDFNNHLPPDHLTFYGKPVFKSVTELDVLKERSDNSGTMPYRIGEVGPWLSSLRRPINYAELKRQETKQQRWNKKFEERYAHKTYSEIFAEKKVTDADNNDCISSSDPDGLLTSRSISGRKAADGSLFPSTTMVPRVPVLLPPIHPSQLPPQPIKVTTSGDGQKVSIDINLILPSSRQQPETVLQTLDKNKTDNQPIHWRSSCDSQRTSRDRLQPTQHDSISQHQMSSHDNVTSRDHQVHQAIIPSPRKLSTVQGGISQDHGGKHAQSFRPMNMCPQGEYCNGIATYRDIYQHSPQVCSTCHIGQNAQFYQSQQLPVAPCHCPPMGMHHTQPPIVMTTGSEVTNNNALLLASPKTHRHVKHGRHGEYRVFCVDDYNKLKREMKLQSSLATQDPETLQEKKEKLAVQQGYGKLVSDKNRHEQLRAKRLLAESMIVQ
jgi:hypothetical protein